MISRGNTQICPLRYVGARQKGSPEKGMEDTKQLYTKLRTGPRCSTSSLHHLVQADLVFLSVASSNGQDGREWRKEIWSHVIAVVTYLCFSKPKIGFLPWHCVPEAMRCYKETLSQNGQCLEKKCLKFV